MRLRAFNFKNLSIRRKQMLIIMLTSSVALLLASIAFVTYDILNFRRELVEDASTTAEMIGHSCVASLDFNDPKSAGEILAATRAEPNILSATVYDREGNLFSTYTRDGTDAINAFPTARPEGHEFFGKKMWLFKAIIVDGKTVGTVFLSYDLRELHENIVHIAMIVAAVLVVSLFAAFIVSLRLQRVVSDPILHLAKMTRTVAVDKNYSVRAVKSPGTGKDELGQLIDGFNEMLAQIQARDTELQKSRELLEGRVEERTAKLAESLSLLNATLESTADGILVVNEQGKMTSCNAKFAQMWRLPHEIIESGNDGDMLKIVVEQLKDEEGFIRRVNELYAAPEMEGLDILEFKDGRVFERYSQPQRLGDSVVGRVWCFRDVTERVRAEDAVREKQIQLAEARNFLEKIINSISEPIFVKNRQHRGILVNDAYCQFSGRSREQEIGRSDHDYFPKNEADVFQLKDQAVFNSGVEDVSEEKFTAANGDIRTIITKKNLYTDEKGGSFIVGVIQDITERKQTEDALRESQALYHSLVNQMPAGLYRKNREGQFVFVNSWFCHLKNMEPDRILGRTASEIAASEMKNPTAMWRSDMADAGIAQHELIMQTGEMTEVEEEYCDEAGKKQYLRVVRSPVYDSGGNITGTQGMIFDITASKEAEAELDYERELFRSLLDNSPDSIFFKDLQSRLVNVSRSEAANLFKVVMGRHRETHPGGSKEQLPDHLTNLERFHKYIIGKTDADFYGKEKACTFSQDEQEIIRTGRPLIGKMEQTLYSDSSSIWHMTTKVPWRNKEGVIVGTFGTSRDVSDLKKAEAKIEETHKKLLKTSRQAGMAEIATNVLHNVGNVLNSVNVSASVAADSVRKSKVSSLAKVVDLLAEHEHDFGTFFSSDPRGKQLPAYLAQLSNHFIEQQKTTIEELNSLRGNIEHIKEIVAMQQTYARVAGVTEFINIKDLVEDSLRMNIDGMDRHGVEIIREFADVPPINIDKHKVIQILLNLLRNAKHACQDSERTDKRLTVRVANGEDRIKIAVIDNGVGIPRENLTRIFSHGFTTRKDGHGFGLHSGALAAKELGGSLNVHSDGIGCGATFTLELPLQPESVIKVVDK